MLFVLFKNDANKIDLSRVAFRNILEGDGLVLANKVCSLFKIVLFLNERMVLFPTSVRSGPFEHYLPLPQNK